MVIKDTRNDQVAFLSFKLGLHLLVFFISKVIRVYMMNSHTRHQKRVKLWQFKSQTVL